MIIKNENTRLLRVLTSIKKFCEYVCIVDTGSTDNTIELVNGYLTDMTRDHTLTAGLIHQARIFVPTGTPLEFPGQSVTDSFGTYYFLNNSEEIERAKKQLPSDAVVVDRAWLREHGWDKSLITEKTAKSVQLVDHRWRSELDFEFDLPRTMSIKMAKERFPDADFLLFLDGDMILVNKDCKKEELTSDCYFLYQVNGDITYPNVRLVRANLPWAVYGRTHEFIDAKDIDVKREYLPVDKIFIDDKNDGGAKSVKLERDERCLTKDIEETPEDTRWWYYRGRNRYYLAEKNSDPSIRKRLLLSAIEDLEQRAKMGGFQDEVWEAYRHIGMCYEKLEDTDMAMMYYIKAFRYDKTRNESLVNCARMFRELTSDQRLAYTFAQMALDLPRPSLNKLFLRPQSYEKSGPAAYEVAICAFYIPERRYEGLVACENILADPWGHNRDHVRENIYPFYARELEATGPKKDVEAPKPEENTQWFLVAKVWELQLYRISTSKGYVYKLVHRGRNLTPFYLKTSSIKSFTVNEQRTLAIAQTFERQRVEIPLN
jgi:glycosyltransferase involved in cell wall biosynthesis